MRIKDRVLLTPTGHSLGALSARDISVLDLEGNLVEGKPPSMESPMHLRLLNRLQGISVVCHCHGPHATAVSSILPPGPNSIPPLTPGFVHCAYPLPLLPFALPGSSELAESVASSMSNNSVRAVLMQNHGIVTVGRDLREAIQIAEEIEEAAQIYLLTNGRARMLSPDKVAQIKKVGA